MTTVIFGGTFGPPHLGHLQSYQWIKNQGHSVWVVPAIAHEFKPHVLPSYLHRREMAKLTFGDDVVSPLEEEVLKTAPLPIRAIDVLRLARNTLYCTKPTCKPFDYKGHPHPVHDFLFAIGPDVQVRTWAGIEDIYDEGFAFIRVPDMGTLRSTEIRNRIQNGGDWDSHVTPKVADYINLHKLYV